MHRKWCEVGAVKDINKMKKYKISAEYSSKEKDYNYYMIIAEPIENCFDSIIQKISLDNNVKISELESNYFEIIIKEC